MLKVLKACLRLNHRAALLFLSFSGARASEVISVKVKHFDAEAGTVLLQNTKNSEARLVPLPAFVNEALQLLDLTDPEAPLFGFSQRFALNGVLKRACARAGVPYMSPHKAGRHAFAARILRDGNSIKALMEAGGWKSLAAVSIYAHLERAQVERAVRNVTTPIGTHLTHKTEGARQSSGNIEEITY